MDRRVEQIDSQSGHSQERLLRSLLRTLGQISVPECGGIDLAVARATEATHAALFKLERKREGDQLVVVTLFGPSGSGKSTLFNVLAGKELSHTSSIERPATRGAMCALPKHSKKELANVLFPTLGRATIESGANRGATGDVTFLKDASADSIIIVDSPDYDTRHDMNREVARRIFCWADLILFVTSVERYADRSSEREFENFVDSQVPIVAVLNRVPKESQELEESFAAEIRRIGIEPEQQVLIREGVGGIDENGVGIDALKAAVHQCLAYDHLNHKAIVATLSLDILPDIERWRADCRALEAELKLTVDRSKELQSDSAIGALEELEESSKFWLRYSPRGVLKGLKTLLTQPSGIFRGQKRSPDSNEEDALGEMVRAQAWEVFESVQVRAREAMQRHRPGQLLLADQEQTQSIEISRNQCDEYFNELAQRLGNFGRNKLEKARREWNDHKKGALAKAQFWAIDKVLRLLTLCLTVAVLPPLVWELLRFIGHPSFTNEVTSEFQEARAEFRQKMREVIDLQIRQYENALDKMGTSSQTAFDLTNLTEQLTSLGQRQP